MALVELLSRLQAVAPVHGVSIGDPADKSTWRVDYDPGATKDQQAAAQAIIAAWTDSDWSGTPQARCCAATDAVLALQLKLQAIGASLQAIPNDPELTARQTQAKSDMDAAIKTRQAMVSAMQPAAAPAKAGAS